jgi:two-component system phosphate regulon response regulator PhoB
MAESDFGSSRSVILVDDDPDVAEMYRLGLEQLGFSVSVEGDGAGLFVALESRLPDIVVLDWNLPGERGDQVLWRLRANRDTAHQPVVILSNFPAQLDGHVDRVFEAGALAWLEKSKTPPQALGVKLAEALESRARI